MTLALSTLAGEGQSPPADGLLTFPTNEQMRHFKAMGELQLSPDGKRVLVRITEATADGAKSHLWLVEVKWGRGAAANVFAGERQARRPVGAGDAGWAERSFSGAPGRAYGVVAAADEWRGGEGV
jgi:hypothetical protein